MAAIHCTYRRCAVGADFSDLCQNLVRQMPFMLNRSVSIQKESSQATNYLKMRFLYFLCAVYL